MEAFSAEQPTSSGTRMPQSPRRPVHQLPPRLNIHPAPTSELGPPAQVQVRGDLSPLRGRGKPSVMFLSDRFVKLPSQRIPVRRQSVGRLTPGVPGSAVSHIGWEFTSWHSYEPLCETFTPLFFPLSLCSSTFSMRMTGWFPALPLWWCLTALMVLIRPSSKCHTHPAASWNTENLLRNYTFTHIVNYYCTTVNHFKTSPGFIMTCNLCNCTEK